MNLFSQNLNDQSQFDKSISQVSSEFAKKLVEKNKKKVVVLYIKDLQKNETQAGKYMADVVSETFVNNSENFMVFDRENLSEIVEAKKLIDEGYIDKEKAKALGRILAVEVIITGNYTVLSNSIKLTLKAFDSNAGLVIASIGKNIQIDNDAAVLMGVRVPSKEKSNVSNPESKSQRLNSNEDNNNQGVVPSGTGRSSSTVRSGVIFQSDGNSNSSNNQRSATSGTIQRSGSGVRSGSTVRSGVTNSSIRK
jgi:TolB-like protein